MSAAAGWYPQPDGQLRYWDGELWTEHFAPGARTLTTPADGALREKASLIAWVSAGALLLLLGIAAAATAGLGGVLIMVGLSALVAGVVAAVRGRLPTLRLATRRAGLVMAASGLAVTMVGGAISPTAANTEATGVVADVVATPSPAEPSSAETTPMTAATPSEAVTVVPSTTAPPTTPPTSTAPKPAAAGTALAAVALLTVKGRAPKTGYTRGQFGHSWFDTDRNGCDTRNDMLRRDLGSRQMKNTCKVLAGTLAPDPYTSTSIRFVYGGASEVDIDHVVALSDAWQKGAAKWAAGKRLAFANDPLNLLAVDASANRSKGDGDTATWLPPNRSYRCTYVARQVAVKGKYGVWVTPAEREAMKRVLTTCPSMRLPGPGAAPTLAALPRAVSPPAPQPAPAPRPVAPAPAPRPVAPAPPAQDVYYANCTAARAAGAAPIMRGEPGYASKLDRDNDGIACE
jgi:hypothetical protein